MTVCRNCCQNQCVLLSPCESVWDLCSILCCSVSFPLLSRVFFFPLPTPWLCVPGVGLVYCQLDKPSTFQLGELHQSLCKKQPLWWRSNPLKYGEKIHLAIPSTHFLETISLLSPCLQAVLLFVLPLPHFSLCLVPWSFAIGLTALL